MNVVFRLARLFSRAWQLLLSCLLICGYFLGQSLPAWAEAAPAPSACQVGVYLLSLRDFNPVLKNFGTDFWVWSVCPSEDLKPLESMEIINSKNVLTAFDSSEEKKGEFDTFQPQDTVYWAQRKVSATIHHEWDVQNFPFDRHILEIPLEESNLDATVFSYIPDTANSSYKADMKVDGWTIQKFSVAESKEKYSSTFGDPDLKSAESDYSRLSVFIEIKRDSMLSFFKLITGVYAAFATVLLSFLLKGGVEFGNRTGLLVGSLFAVLVSMQRIDAVLGQSEALTMVDSIHVTALFYIFAAVMAAVYSRLLNERGFEKESLQFDRQICFSMFSISFVIFNIVVIVNAFVRG